MTIEQKTIADTVTLGEFLDIWVEEDLKTGSMSNGTVELYQNVVKVIKRDPICNRRLSLITSEDLQEYINRVSIEKTGNESVSHDDYAKKPYTVLNHAFRYAVLDS